jgi:hypothetical protein
MRINMIFSLTLMVSIIAIFGAYRFVSGYGNGYQEAEVKPIHGMYFASHFFNFYHVAPIEQVYRLQEDLALRGCNALMAWYDAPIPWH